MGVEGAGEDGGDLGVVEDTPFAASLSQAVQGGERGGAGVSGGLR